MKATVTVDTTEFKAALREFAPLSRSTLADIVNRRAFFLLARVFVLLKPQQLQAFRNKVRAYLNEPIGERRFDKATGKKVGRARILRRVHLIVQAKRRNAGEKGLYGDEMKEAAAKFRRQSIGSVGYLKSGVAKAIKQLRGTFTQFGRQEKIKLQPGQVRRSSREIDGNAALIKLANEYGTSMDNVGMHKGAKAYTTKAQPGFNPTAIADIAWNIKDGQEGNVSAVVNHAFQRAFDDEATEMKAEIARRMQDLSNQFMSPEFRRAA